jgi:hypothetical protein
VELTPGPTGAIQLITAPLRAAPQQDLRRQPPCLRNVTVPTSIVAR